LTAVVAVTIQLNQSLERRQDQSCSISFDRAGAGVLQRTSNSRQQSVRIASLPASLKKIQLSSEPF